MPRVPWLAAIGFGLLAAARPAGAVDVAALYQAYWAGLPAGEIWLQLHDGATVYRDTIDMRTEGLPRLLTRFSGTAVSEGRDASTRPQPQQYEARYALRKKHDRRLVMRFDLRGGAVIADRGPGDSSKKPPLPARFRTNVVDPLSALTAIRDVLRLGNRGPFSVPVYDGARRFDIVARVLPKQPGDANLQLRLTLMPVAGFKGESSDDGDPDDAPRPALLTMTDDQRLMPLSFSVSLAYLPLDIELKRWCGSAAACRW
ncbi:MAG TPA: DUF3108 domain-containing protein [Stellaceae bacterium]|nr:DUF3108 domain-containing protein [Stellaceae bacterium]